MTIPLSMHMKSEIYFLSACNEHYFPLTYIFYSKTVDLAIAKFTFYNYTPNTDLLDESYITLNFVDISCYAYDGTRIASKFFSSTINLFQPQL